MPVTMAPMCSLTFSIFMAWEGSVDAAALMIRLLVSRPADCAGAFSIPENHSRQQHRPNVRIDQVQAAARRRVKGRSGGPEGAALGWGCCASCRVTAGTIV